MNKPVPSSSPTPNGRPLGGIESFFWWANARHGTLTLVATLKCEGPLDPERFREAARRMHHAWPMLSAAFVRAPSGVVRLAPGFLPEPDVRLLPRSSDTTWEQAAEALLNEPFAGSVQENGSEVWPRLWSVSILYGADRHEILLRLHHGLVDGINVGQLIHALLQTYAEPHRAADILGTQGVSPPVEEFLPSGPRTWSTLRFYREEARNLFRTPKPDARSPDQTSDDPQRTLACFTTFSEAETTALLQRSKAEGTTLNAALCAAALWTTFEHFPDRKRLSFQSNVDLRRRHGISLAPQQIGIYIYWIKTWHRRVTGDFWTLARAYRDESTRAIADLGLPPWGFFPLARTFLDRQARSFPLGQTSDAIVSNVGVFPLQAEYGDLRPRELYLATSQNVIGTRLCWLAGTLNGRLGLSCSVRHPLETREQGRDALEELRKHLLEACS